MYFKCHFKGFLSGRQHFENQNFATFIERLFRDNTMTKYRLSNETRPWRWQDGSTPCTTPLRQIIAVKDFNDVTSGTKGGWVEDEHALAQTGLLGLR